MTKIKIPSSEKQSYICITNEQNIQRIIVVVMTMGIFQFLQVVYYLLAANRDTYDMELVYIKTCIVTIILIILIILKKAKPTSILYKNNSVNFISILMLVLIILSIINTFKAQTITSDISIYILTLFLIVATVRIQPYITAIVQILGYLFFALGMPHFQSNTIFLTSHLMNGLIINILAFIISIMFYRYSVRDYIDKLDIEKKNAELIFLSQRDGLTGLYNHITIHMLLDEAIIRANKTKEILYLALLDLDHFKEINDVYGHKYGDEVLLQVSLQIKAITDATVTAGRYGGDEFMLFFEQHDEDKVLGSLKSLLNHVSAIDVRGHKLTYSCGVTKWNGESVDQLIEKADKYMYQVKMSGRNNVVITQDGE